MEHAFTWRAGSPGKGVEGSELREFTAASATAGGGLPAEVPKIFYPPSKLGFSTAEIGTIQTPISASSSLGLEM